ncbi:hypothetical protein CAP51_01960 [Acinetobacter populi]|uniref:Uncharacterized protein n=2 Tax=Acinetobacter populi TaxID=1582270 RepID=A0A1Z9Z1U2_9GAMM|nr:hypothetical protein CAP51_01960 [Acinetobacter populi]
MMGYLSMSLKLSTLSVALLTATSVTFALEKLDDATLADATGEGIAILPEDFSLRFNGSNDSGAGTLGAGYIHLIPVGPLSATQESKNFQKSDIYLYGLSLAQSKKGYGQGRTASDWGVPYGALGTGANDFGQKIGSWGTESNPWIFKTITNTVPNFIGESKSVSAMILEAPLKQVDYTDDGTGVENLKLGLWTDAFMRDKNVVENGYDGLSNRLRLGIVWDGFGVSGSNLKLFRTTGGVTSAMGGTYTANLKINDVITPKTFNYGLSTSYNETLGLAGIFRLNSGKTNGADAKATVTMGPVTRNIYQLDYVGRDAAGNPLYTQGVNVTANPNTSSGLVQTYTPLTNANVPGSYPNGGMCTSPAANTYQSSAENNGACFYREGFTARRFVASATNSWTMPAAKSVLRISTQELLSAVTALDKTPALGETAVPNFNANSSSAEGLFFYNPNINLVIGSLYQPLVFNTDGSNFSIELARIPNNVNVYSKIYQRYSDIDPVATVDPTVNYLGTTCNIHKCGGTVTIDGKTYQDSQATHSSISIGSTNYDASTNRLTAYNGIESFGVSIGALVSGTNLTGGDLVQDYTQVWNSSRTATRSGNIIFGYTYAWNAYGAWTAVAPKAPTSTNSNPYETTYRQNTNNQILGIQTTMPTNINTTLNNMNPVGATVNNNFGSAVIDGLLIQHFKMTTTGL